METDTVTATPPCCSHCFLVIAFMFLECASPSEFPAILPSLHQNVIFSVSIREHIIWIAEQCKFFMILFPIYHLIVKPGLIQLSLISKLSVSYCFQSVGPKFTALWGLSRALIYLQIQDLQVGFFPHKETCWEHLLSFHFCVSVNMVGRVALESWAAVTACVPWTAAHPSSGGIPGKWH